MGCLGSKPGEAHKVKVEASIIYKIREFAFVKEESSKVVTRVEAPVTVHLKDYVPYLEKYKMAHILYV